MSRGRRPKANKRTSRPYSPKCLERLSEKSFGGLWSVGFSSVTLQEKALCVPFRQFVRSLLKVFESFQTVSEEVFSGLRCLAAGLLTASFTPALVRGRNYL